MSFFDNGQPMRRGARVRDWDISSELISALTIPIFSGVIGYVTNWTGVWMLFYPVQFRGFRLPGLKRLASILPRKVQQIPGIMQGGVGWQGILPSRAAKMGSIAVDKGIAKVGSAAEFYEHLEPELLAEHILDSSRGDIRELVERVMRREHPQLWQDLPEGLREAVHRRVQDQLPDIVHDVTDEIGDNIDQLLDIKLMVIRHLEERPGLVNRVYQETGERELKFIINFGFFFGFTLGIPVIFLTHALPVLVGAADSRRGHRRDHQLARAEDDLRAGGAQAQLAASTCRGCSSSARRRRPTSTPT